MAAVAGTAIPATSASAATQRRAPRSVVLVHGAYADGSCWSDVIGRLQHGHSFAGTVISQVGDHPAVSSLVYLSARGPEAGEDYPALAAKFPPAPASAGLVYHNGFGQLTEGAFLNDFANGVPRARARVLYACQGTIAQTLFPAKTTVAAWKLKPTRYLVTTADRTTDPGLQRFVAQRMNAKTIEADSGHLSMITHSATATRLILDAVYAH